MNVSFPNILKQVLEEIKEGIISTDRFAPFLVDHCASLLEDDTITVNNVQEHFPSLYYYSLIAIGDVSHLSDLCEENSTQADVLSAIGYPRMPFYLAISKAICQWVESRDCPIKFFPMSGLTETEDDTLRLQSLTPKILGLACDWLVKSENDQKEIALNILEELGLKGTLTLLKVRRTKGSVMQFPPGMGKMLSACNEAHVPGGPAKITVAGRAHSKHSQRSLDNWWGLHSGPEMEKNKRAEKVVRKILTNAAWINVHKLPHDVATVEVRNKDGYGLRWYADGSKFRGFLEPQMLDGHEKGWIH